MASGNGDGVFRRMVKMVAHPARELISRPPDAASSQFADVEKAELKAMIERKRRNDFVRKRELDMLRRIRREGLNAEQAQALSASSRIDDSDVKATQLPGGPDRSVKAKIDAIERQMVGMAGSAGARMPKGVAPPPTLSTPLPPPSAPVRQLATPAPVPMHNDDATRPMVDWHETGLPKAGEPLPPGLPPGITVPVLHDTLPPPLEPLPARASSASGGASAASPTPSPAAPATPSPAPAPAAAGQPIGQGHVPDMEVSEISHDQELDEAVIAFANADFALCERALRQLTGANGLRHGHNDTWLVLFDFYRATGQQANFDSLTNDYVMQLQRSAPQWYSLPQLVAEATAAPARGHASEVQMVAWVCPADLDVDGVAQLDSQTLQLPQPWALDWTRLAHLDADAAARLYRLMQGWARQPLQMRWLGTDRLFQVLQEAAPVGMRDADPAYWMTRMEALRLVNRPDQFDEVAIDYCVTYEVSPPSWEKTRCAVRLDGAGASTQAAPLSVISEAVTTLQELGEGEGSQSLTTLELSGQLSGDIGALLGVLDSRLGEAKLIHISCALLIRVDFIAAGDLLNWVIAKRAEGRQIRFTDVHRLVALMFRAMGIIEHAPVQLRQV
ncbi:STAS domain-containing protein [Ideonella dechloratans]|uniref:STAS domain-containing protein n=1 Tax=Ideonella dechloratans TaxID=36863 RepID=A0A643F8Z1_IDEDE|nr:STAS domain-containing protein [Ideonella dechloratans]KAB0577707.1 STAS domain-containing protein [Ideonella dechloratans]UFU10661.1 STAS domain-containing protein [Ideonella dechloratans]